MELSSVFGGDTLKAADLQGMEPVVVIASVTMKKFENGNKLVLTFQGKKKGLVCNKTNANRIAYVHGTNTDNWIGKEIQLFTDLVDFQGTVTQAIRVRPAPQRNGGGQHAIQDRGGHTSMTTTRPPAAPPDEHSDEIPF